MNHSKLSKSLKIMAIRSICYDTTISQPPSIWQTLHHILTSLKLWHMTLKLPQPRENDTGVEPAQETPSLDRLGIPAFSLEWGPTCLIYILGFLLCLSTCILVVSGTFYLCLYLDSGRLLLFLISVVSKVPIGASAVSHDPRWCVSFSNYWSSLPYISPRLPLPPPITAAPTCYCPAVSPTQN